MPAPLPASTRLQKDGGAQCARPSAVLATVHTSLAGMALYQTAPILPLSRLEELHLLDGLMLQSQIWGRDMGGCAPWVTMLWPDVGADKGNGISSHRLHAFKLDQV